MKLDKTLLAISALSVTAVLMLVGMFVAPSANASMVIKDRDYQVITARVQNGGDGLYIVDNRTGLMAVFTYDPALRTVRPRAVRAVAEAFQVK
jgi:hypothetical protein